VYYYNISVYSYSKRLTWHIVNSSKIACAVRLFHFKYYSNAVYSMYLYFKYVKFHWNKRRIGECKGDWETERDQITEFEKKVVIHKVMCIFHTFSRFEPNRLAADRKLDVSMARNKSDVCSGHGDNVIIFHIYTIYIYTLCVRVYVRTGAFQGDRQRS